MGRGVLATTTQCQMAPPLPNGDAWEQKLSTCMLHHQLFPPSTHPQSLCTLRESQYSTHTTLYGCKYNKYCVYGCKKGQWNSAACNIIHQLTRTLLCIHVCVPPSPKRNSVMCRIDTPTCVHSYSVCIITHSHRLYKETGKW